MKLTLIPPDDVSPGKYDIRLRSSGMSDNEPVTADNKSATIEIRAETNALGTLAVVALVLSLVGGIVTYGIRLSKR